MTEVMITTYDNPFDPFDEEDSWFQFDSFHGYHTCEKLGMLAATSIYLSDEENEREISSAIDKMIEEEPLLYKKVTRTLSD